ncbi:hypothetical protein BJ165DRAFT_1598735 [Panaeolus papilionaceus]|nr:hypothetical protein BJ165DRAFT_1598735 [Panaeolus papilionaceus]
MKTIGVRLSYFFAPSRNAGSLLDSSSEPRELNLVRRLEWLPGNAELPSIQGTSRRAAEFQLEPHLKPVYIATHGLLDIGRLYVTNSLINTKINKSADGTPYLFDLSHGVETIAVHRRTTKLTISEDGFPTIRLGAGYRAHDIIECLELGVRGDNTVVELAISGRSQRHLAVCIGDCRKVANFFRSFFAPGRLPDGSPEYELVVSIQPDNDDEDKGPQYPDSENANEEGAGADNDSGLDMLATLISAMGDQRNWPNVFFLRLWIRQLLLHEIKSQ